MNIVLYKLCKHCVALMDSWHPYPSTALSKTCGMTLYQTRKELKKLKQDGIVDSDIEVLKDDEGCFILRGYTITDKARKTQEYKKAWQEEREICKKYFDIDIGKVEE